MDIIFLGIIAIVILGILSFLYPAVVLYIALISSAFYKLTIGKIGIVQVLPFEIVILILILVTLLRVWRDIHKSKPPVIDIFIFGYAAYALLSALLIAPDTYASVKNYRISILVPIIFYYLHQYYVHSTKQIRQGIIFFNLALAPVFLFAIGLFFESGLRPEQITEFMSLISLSLLLSLFILHLIYNHLSSAKRYNIIYVLLIALNAGTLLITETRAAVLGVILCLIITPFILKYFRKATIFFVTAAIFIAAIGYLFYFKQGYYIESDMRDVDLKSRLTSVEGMKDSLDKRIFVQKQLVEGILDSILFGKGDRYSQMMEISEEGMAHPHNIIISILLEYGLIGLLLFFVIIYTIMKNLVEKYAKSEVLETKKMIQFCFSGIIMFLLVGLTNDILVGGRGMLFWWFLSVCKVVLSMQAGNTVGYHYRRAV